MHADLSWSRSCPRAGVGGWSESGVDPGVFSQALMYYAQRSTDDLRAEALKSADEEAGCPIYPHDILRTAYDAVMQDKEVVAGKSCYFPSSRPWMS